MTTATQQLPSNPARDFANIILEETNGGLELIEILHDIAQGNDEDATENDRITASTILLDRGLGKCPRQSPATTGSNPDPAPETEVYSEPAEEACPEPAEEGRGACPERSRRVTQIDDTLHQSLGPPHSACPEPVLSIVEGSIQTTIQQHILTITNGGRTLFAALAEIARAHDAPETEPALSKAEGGRMKKTSHRTRATRILIDRLAGTDLMPAHNAVCPECRRKWTAHSHPDTQPEREAAVSQDPEDQHSNEEIWAEIEAEFQRLQDEGIITVDPDAPPIDLSGYRMPKDYVLDPEVAKQEAAAFWAEIDLRLERQKAWPAIEERRRKKLANIYPSHSNDDDPPDT